MDLKVLFYGSVFMIFVLQFNESNTEAVRPWKELPLATGLKMTNLSSKYYVSPVGNDSYRGSSVAPFLTIQRAADIVNPGDTVIIKNGTYATNGAILINLSRGGSDGMDVVFIAENIWGAILDGKGITVTGWNITNGASYVQFINLAITGFRESGFNANHSGFVSQHITVQGNKISDIGRYETTSPYGICGIYLRKGNHHWTIDKNLIYNIGRTGPENYFMNKDHAVYTGTTDSPANAAHQINITYNVMYGISGAHITTGSNDDLIANNVMAWRNENRKGASCFIAVDAEVTGLTLANNIFYQPPASNPFSVNGYAPFTGWAIKNNMVYGGRMWNSSNANTRAAMAGGNYGQTDCEKAEVNPEFVFAVKANAPHIDFSLQKGSPAINAGVRVGLTSDYLGNPIMGHPDIGAYEYLIP